jgi:hypothetical protein
MALNSVFTLTSSLRLSSFQRTIKKSFERIAPSKLNKQRTCHKLFCLAHMSSFILRKEVIQPHLPIRLPCYDFTPIICPTLGGWLLAVTPPTSGVTNSRGVTGGVYKARERIHRGMLIRDY